ncbi:hypothetical protein [Amycolatopsis nigrescens]|uniref:hypothetical protein n=1 Tax=Amycolatopsis nigrescens TaxID=381445 RepID=UPI0012FB9198|nr:hypothetical protein [Amycolatopsis nigrescens]
MTFSCTLKRPTKKFRTDKEPYSTEDFSDYETLAIYACSLLAETDGEFKFGGFGKGDWHLDIGYDMSAIIEQLPDLLNFLHAREAGELDLYPPGVECTLKFLPHGDMVVIECHSRTSWIPEPPVEQASYAEVELIFETLAVDFAVSLDLVQPNVSNLSPFCEWRDGWTRQHHST